MTRLRKTWLPLVLGFSLGCAASGERALSVYYGRYTDASLPEQILVSEGYDYEDSRLGVLAYSEVIGHFADGDGQTEWEVQFGKHWGQQSHVEVNALALVRWKRFPWSDSLRTSVALGDGLSWASETPFLEAASHSDHDSSQLLNYLLLEGTLGLPAFPRWDVILRIHHRSGVFGLFDGVAGGSNVLALGLRVSF